MSQPRPLIAGNWKMNGLRSQLDEIARIRDGVARLPAHVDFALLLPATLLVEAAQLCRGSRLAIGGQTCHAAASGAHTGDISAEMLKDAGASLVLVGHSERRLACGETDAAVQAQAAAALRGGLGIVICVGETAEERANGRTLEVVGRQVKGSLPHPLEAGRLTLAYEPVWAIGTGLTPTPGDVAEVHEFIRVQLGHLLGRSGAMVRLVYGGSVKPANAAELMAVAHVDGALVGGASLRATDFLAIAAAYGPPA
jgi:triosephosphate isomerase (TIM)